MSEESNIENVQDNSSANETPCNCGCADASKKVCRCKIKKTIMLVIGATAAVIALLLIFRDMYIPYAVSKAGTFVLGTKVELKKFSSSLTGKVDIQGLSVANPEGYRNPKAFELERVYVDLSVFSLFTDEITVREILVTGMKVDLESKLNRTNLGDIQKNVEQLIPQKAEETASNKENEKAKSVVIEKLNINNNLISFSNSALHLTVNIPLLPISMTDIGKGQSIAETMNEILLHILTSVFDACSSLGGAIGDSLKGTGAFLSDSASSVGKGISNAAGNIGQELSNTTGNISKGISDTTKKLFKGF